MKTTARQFFDIWCQCANWTRTVRQSPELDIVAKHAIIAGIKSEYGPATAIEALAYFERLRADTQAGISSL